MRMHQQVAYCVGVVWCKLSWHTCNEIMMEPTVNNAMPKFIAILMCIKVYVHRKLRAITGSLNVTSLFEMHIYV